MEKVKLLTIPIDYSVSSNMLDECTTKYINVHDFIISKIDLRNITFMVNMFAVRRLLIHFLSNFRSFMHYIKALCEQLRENVVYYTHTHPHTQS